MTTSVALMARGRVIQAAKVQPFGVMLFSALAVASAVGLYELAGGKSLVHRLRPGLWWVWLGLGGMLVGWGIKAGVGHLAGRYPLP